MLKSNLKQYHFKKYRKDELNLNKTYETFSPWTF